MAFSGCGSMGPRENPRGQQQDNRSRENPADMTGVYEHHQGTYRAYAMNKSEVLQALQYLEAFEPRMSSWTLTELRAVLQEKMRLERDGISPIDKELKRVDRLKKQDIIAEILQRYPGVTLTGNEQKKDLLRKLRNYLEGQELLTPEEIVSFGKMQGKTFLQVQQSYPDYARWAVNMWMEDPDHVCGGLRRLAMFLEGVRDPRDLGTLDPGSASHQPRVPTPTRVKKEAKEEYPPTPRDQGPIPTTPYVPRTAQYVPSEARGSFTVKKEEVEIPRPKMTAVKSKAKPKQRPQIHHIGSDESYMAVSETPILSETEDL
jgi:hypothetical protein